MVVAAPRRGRAPGDDGVIDFGNLLLVGKYQLVPESPGLPSITSFFGTIFPTTHYRRLNPSNLWMDQLGDGAISLSWALRWKDPEALHRLW